MNIQTEWARRSMDLKRLRDELAGLESKGSGAQPGGTAKPVDPSGGAAAQRFAGFAPSAQVEDADIYPGAKIEGARLDAGDTGTIEACVQTCRSTSGCVGVAMEKSTGQCAMFKSITGLTKDQAWTAGVRALRKASQLDGRPGR